MATFDHMGHLAQESPAGWAWLCSYHTGEESERLQVLQDVAVLGGDEDHVELLQRLVHVAHAVGLHEGVLLARVHQFGERREQTLDTRPGHFHKLPGDDGLSGLGAHRRCQQHLQVRGRSGRQRARVQTYRLSVQVGP